MQSEHIRYANGGNVRSANIQSINRTLLKVAHDALDNQPWKLNGSAIRRGYRYVKLEDCSIGGYCLSTRITSQIHTCRSLCSWPNLVTLMLNLWGVVFFTFTFDVSMNALAWHAKLRNPPCRDHDPPQLTNSSLHHSRPLHLIQHHHSSPPGYNYGAAAHDSTSSRVGQILRPTQAPAPWAAYELRVTYPR